MEKTWESVYGNISALLALIHILDVSDDIVVAGDYLSGKMRDGTLDPDGWARHASDCKTIAAMRGIAIEFLSGDIVDLMDKDNRGE